MDKEGVVHTYNGILVSHKKNEIIPFVATWMDLEIIILGKVSLRKTNIISLTCGILKNGTNELIYKIETDSQTLKTDLWLPKGKGGGKDKFRSLELTYIHYYIGLLRWR